MTTVQSDHKANEKREANAMKRSTELYLVKLFVTEL